MHILKLDKHAHPSFCTPTIKSRLEALKCCKLHLRIYCKTGPRHISLEANPTEPCRTGFQIKYILWSVHGIILICDCKCILCFGGLWTDRFDAVCEKKNPRKTASFSHHKQCHSKSAAESVLAVFNSSYIKAPLIFFFK